MALMFTTKGYKEYMAWRNKVERERKNKERKNKSRVCKLEAVDCEFFYDLECNYGLDCPHKKEIVQ